MASFTDNFTRADVSAIEGSFGWESQYAAQPIGISTNRAYMNGAGGDRTAAYSNNTLGVLGEQTIQFTFLTASANTVYTFVHARINGQVGTRWNAYYAAFYYYYAFGVDIYRENVSGGQYTLLANSGDSFRPEEGDILKMTAVGSTITAFVNGVQKVTTSDASYATGYPGMGLYSLSAAQTPYADDFTASAPGGASGGMLLRGVG